MRRSIEQIRDELQRRQRDYEKARRARRRQLCVGASALVLCLVIGAVLLPWSDLVSRPEPPTASSDPPKGEPTTPYNPGVPQSVAPSTPPKAQEPGTTYGDTCYSDGVESFDELVEQADVIVLAKVVETVEPSPTTQTATLRVIAALRDLGEALPEEISLYQMQGSGTVQVGASYLLFLKQQVGVEHAFYSIGGGQGTLGYDGGRIVSAQQGISLEEAEDWLQARLPGTVK